MSWIKGKEPFVIIILGVLLISIAKFFQPVPLDWSPNFSEDAKIPYGSYLVNELIEPIFPANEVESSYKSIYDFYTELDENSLNSTNLLLINFYPGMTGGGSFKTFTDFDIEKLLTYVDEGNSVFIADHNFPAILRDTLSFNTNGINYFLKDSQLVKFKNPSIENSFYAEGKMIKQYFNEIDTTNATILASTYNIENDDELPILISKPFGKGQFIISATPHLFSNYNMVTADGYKYISTAFSYLPNQHTYWDEYYKPNKKGFSSSPLRYVLSQKALKWAVYITLFSLIFYIIFKSRRVQRIIPVIEPLPNLNLDFAKTIGMLYYHKRDNADIAKKRVKYCLTYIRKKYYLNTNILDQSFTENLISKSRMAKNDATILVNYINTVQNNNNISDEVLLRLNQFIDQFYQVAKN